LDAHGPPSAWNKVFLQPVNGRVTKKMNARSAERADDVGSAELSLNQIMRRLEAWFVPIVAGIEV
jgi:hypothetical protein